MANLQKLIDVMLSQGGVDLSNYYTKASLYTRDECDARFAPKGSGSSDLSRYLLKTEAASTYLTQSNAQTTYLTQSNAQGTYATRAWAQGQFLTQSSADDRYQLKGSGGSGDTSGTITGSQITDGRYTVRGNVISVSIYGEGAGSNIATIPSQYCPNTVGANGYCTRGNGGWVQCQINMFGQINVIQQNYDTTSQWRFLLTWCF